MKTMTLDDVLDTLEKGPGLFEFANNLSGRPLEKVMEALTKAQFESLGVKGGIYITTAIGQVGKLIGADGD